MKITNQVKKVLIGLYKSMKRFPVTIALSAAVAVTLIMISEIQIKTTSGNLDTLKKLSLIFALGIPLSLCIKLFLERSNNKSFKKNLTFYSCEAVILVLYYLFLLKNLNMVSETRFVGINLALYLCFLILPYTLKKPNFEMYIIKVISSFFRTVLYSAVLFGGLSAILFTIDKLLNIRVASKVYYYTFLFVVFLFAISYFLAGIPNQRDEFTKDEYPKILRILNLNIIMPLLTAYTIILYIYFVKIIFTRKWPIGLVSNLVLWFSIILVIILFLSTPIKNDSLWGSIFSKWSPRVIIPILIMMFISIGIRINAYGVTESRYYVVLLGIWSIGSFIYFIIYNGKMNIVIPLFLSILSIIAVLGPLSSYSVSKLSQNNRLESILSKNDMLSNGKIVKATKEVSKNDKNEVSRIIDYFERNHNLSDIKSTPKDFKRGDMENVFGFAYENIQYNLNEGYFNYMRNGIDRFIEIGGYDYLFDTRTMYNGGKLSSNEKIDINYDNEKAIIKVTYEGKLIYQKDMKKLVQNLYDKYGMSEKENSIPNEELTFTDENEKIKIKIIIISIAGKKDLNSDDIQINGIDYYTLIKLK